MFLWPAARRESPCWLTLLLAFSWGCVPPGRAPALSGQSARAALVGTGSREAEPLFAVPTGPHEVQLTRRRRDELHDLLRRMAYTPGVALGHQDTTAYGVGWSNQPDRSDVKDVCGAHAAVYGWDLFGIEKNSPKNGDGVAFSSLQRLIAQADEAGGINTLSWHVGNPATGGSAWDTSRSAAREVLPGGRHHDVFRGYLDRVASFLDALRGASGERIPLIVRLFHEQTGDWFWWGTALAKERDYAALFRFSVDYLRTAHGLDQLLFGFSVDAGQVGRRQDVLYGYPGDEYVDLLGLDLYFEPGATGFLDKMGYLVDQARELGKVPALTEFGPRGGVNSRGVGPSWFSETVLGPLLADERGRQLAYVLAWRNARTDHAFLPYAGHPAAADLESICARPDIWLTPDLARMRRGLRAAGTQ